MSIGILLITHPGIGAALVATACGMLEHCPLETRCLDVPPDVDMAHLVERARQALDSIDDGSGVLILTDAFGSTPSNIAHQIAEDHRTQVVSGVNLPMLIRIFNYCSDNLDSLTRKAAEGGIRGIHASLPLHEESG